MEEPSNFTVYEETTNFPTKTILSKATNGNLPPSAYTTGKWKRVIVVRYTGSVREIVPEEYELFKSKMASGVYQAITFTWALAEKHGQSAQEYNLAQIEGVIKRVDGALHQRVRNWFARELPEAGKQVSLAVDIQKYISPLRT